MKNTLSDLLSSFIARTIVQTVLFGGITYFIISSVLTGFSGHLTTNSTSIESLQESVAATNEKIAEIKSSVNEIKVALKAQQIGGDYFKDLFSSIEGFQKQIDGIENDIASFEQSVASATQPTDRLIASNNAFLEQMQVTFDETSKATSNLNFEIADKMDSITSNLKSDLVDKMDSLLNEVKEVRAEIQELRSLHGE